jgi:5-methylcytosine-specific restriction endonuclease McrA
VRPSHCKNGHAFTEENTYVRPSNGKRACRICLRNKASYWRAKHPDREILEHPMPLSRGGSHGIDNWVLSCFDCNASKGNKTEQEFLEKRNVRESRPRAQI